MWEDSPGKHFVHVVEPVEIGENDNRYTDFAAPNSYFCQVNEGQDNTVPVTKVKE
jgi:hypothetical protein